MITTNFAMVQHHGWGYSDLQDMPVWERAIYIEMLNKHLMEEHERLKKSHKYD